MQSLVLFPPHFFPVHTVDCAVADQMGLFSGLNLVTAYATSMLQEGSGDSFSSFLGQEDLALVTMDVL